MYEDLPEIVLELGINANGSTELAKQMIDMGIAAARSTGYPLEKVLFKFQKRTPELATPRAMWRVKRESPVSGKMVDYIDYKHEMEFDCDDYTVIDEYTRRLGVWFFASVWDRESALFMYDSFPFLPYLKVPSAHLTNESLLVFISDFDTPVILSTGMSTESEITAALAKFDEQREMVILSSTASYPCIDEEINLLKIRTLDDLYSSPSRRIGFSSHSISPYPSIYSNFFDVDMIEVHLTLDRSMKGSDQAASLEKPAVELLMRETLRIPELYGTGELKVYQSELAKRMSLRGY